MDALFVTKDLASDSAVLLAEMMTRMEYTVGVIAEGKSVPLWIAAGFPLIVRGPENFEAELFNFDDAAADKLLTTCQPKAVICCEGAPINLEEKMGLAANRARIPLVFLEDFWGGFNRSRARPNILLTVDDYAFRLAKAAIPDVPTAIVGNRGVKDIVIPGRLSQHMEVLRREFRHITVFGGQGSVEDLALCIKCMEKTEGCLIPRFHPKHVNVRPPEGGTYGELWKEMLNKLDDKVVWLDEFPTDPVVALADVVCSGFSTLLTTGAWYGRKAVSLWTPEVERELLRHTKLGEVPQVELGIAVQISSEIDLSMLKFPPQEALAKLQPYDPQAAYEAIKHLL